MNLTGVSSRAVTYAYYSASFADTAEYVITQNAIVDVSSGTVAHIAKLQVSISGNGSVWSALVDSAAYPHDYAVGANKFKVHNGVGGATVLHIVGVYWT